MKQLFAHVFPVAIHGVAAATPAAAATATAAADPRRGVFRDLVVRRAGYAAWGLSNPATPRAAAVPREPAAEPLWPDTQPWCHE